MKSQKTHSRFRPSRSPLAMLCGATLLGTMASHAAVSAITGVTVSGGDDQVRTLTSITVGGTTYNNLLGASSGTTTAGSRYWIQTDPGTSNATLAGLTISDGVLNSVASFQFGRTLTASDMLFFFDLENDDTGDAISIRLINSSGADVGDAALSIAASGFGSRVFTDGFSTNDGAVSGVLAGGTYGPIGTSFLVTDFSGDVSTATGFRIIQGGTVNIDPMVGGLAVIPEPGSVALAAGALCFGLLRRKRA